MTDREPHLTDRARRAQATLTDRAPAVRCVVPGRLEVLGKHTDYVGGRSLVCAIDRGLAFVASARGDNRVRLIDAGDGAIVEVRLDPALPPVDGWATYPAAVCRRLSRNFPEARTGADIAFASDLPAAAGLSSSSALIVGVLNVLSHVNTLADTDTYREALPTQEALASYAATIENGRDFGPLAGDGGGVGTLGGSEDHLAIVCGEADRLLQYAFDPVRRERTVTLPRTHVFVVGMSGIVAAKTGNAREAYNRASRAAQRIVELWRSATGHDDRSLGAALARDDGPALLREVVERARDPEYPGAQLSDRLEQFIAESEHIVPAAADLIARGQWTEFGALVDRSQHAAERRLGNQTPETTALARLARALGASAASAFGAGFGGSVWALVPAASALEFRAAWADTYREAFSALAAPSGFFIVRPSAGARGTTWTS